jgi:hypothetical protein
MLALALLMLIHFTGLLLLIWADPAHLNPNHQNGTQS